MIDGKHTGTGGGNHVVVGGATPNDSPFLRRPDLLKSLVLYWQRHPSLSYLFSGLFIGPTSQAPRFDEARHDSLYELEIALAQVPLPGKARAAALAGRPAVPQPAGRRHRQHASLGNLHRQAVLARRPTGRLGLVEFRGFEMPPNARMSLAQHCWCAPSSRDCGKRRSTASSRAGAPRCTTASCCRTMSGDFLDVLEDLRQNGLRIRPEWFNAQLEFRFPYCGEISHAGIKLEISQALSHGT